MSLFITELVTKLIKIFAPSRFGCSKCKMTHYVAILFREWPGDCVDWRDWTQHGGPPIPCAWGEHWSTLLQDSEWISLRHALGVSSLNSNEHLKGTLPSKLVPALCSPTDSNLCLHQCTHFYFDVDISCENFDINNFLQFCSNYCHYLIYICFATFLYG